MRRETIVFLSDSIFVVYILPDQIDSTAKEFYKNNLKAHTIYK